MTHTAQAQEIELLPPKSKTDLGSVLKNIEETLKIEIAAFNSLDNEARWRGLRIGMLLNLAKPLCPHGTFETWRKQSFPAFGDRHARRLQKYAVLVVRELKLPDPKVKLLCAPDAQEESEAKPVIRKITDYFGDRTLSDIFDDLNIKERPKLGGARDKKRGKITHAMRVECAKATVQNLIDLLHTEIIKGKEWVLVDRQLIENLHDTLRDAKDRVSPALKKIG